MNSITTLETWMPEARQLAAQCWCDDETKGIEMDTRIAEAAARRIAAWMDTAAMFNRNSDFYQGIVVEIGEMFGEEAKTSDDGSIQEDVLALKVPELVKRLLSENGPKSSDGSGFPKSGSSSPATVREQMEGAWLETWTVIDEAGSACMANLMHGTAELAHMPKGAARNVANAHNAAIQRLAPSGIVEQPKKETDLGKP